MAVSFVRECFFIAPIGDKGSAIRKRSDGLKKWVVAPAAEELGLETVRADDVGEPGQITSQAVQHCLKAKAAVADLTGGNPNVYYELSVRHGAQLPVVLIAEQGTVLPFDLGQSRAIFFDHTDLSDAARAREELGVQIKASLNKRADNPIMDGMRLAELEGGNVEERALARIMERLQRLGVSVEKLEERLVDGKKDRPATNAKRTKSNRNPTSSMLVVQKLLEEGRRRPRNGISAENVRTLEETEPVPLPPNKNESD